MLFGKFLRSFVIPAEAGIHFQIPDLPEAGIRG